MPTWVTTAFSTLVNLPSAIAAVVNAWIQRDKENNTPVMQDNALSLEDKALREKFTKDQSNADIEAIRKSDAH